MKLPDLRPMAMFLFFLALLMLVAFVPSGLIVLGGAIVLYHVWRNGIMLPESVSPRS